MASSESDISPPPVDDHDRSGSSFDAFLRLHHAPTATALAITLDDFGLGLEAADRAFARLSAGWSATTSARPVELYDAGLRWIGSSGRRLSTLLHRSDDGASSTLAGSLAPPAAAAFARATPAQRESAVRSVYFGDPDVGIEPELISAIRTLDGQLEPPLTSAEALHDLRVSGRMRALTSTASALVLIGVLLAGATYGVARLLGEGGIVTEVTTAPSESDGTGNELGQARTRRLVWEESGSPIGFANGSTVDGGTVYVLSTAPRGSIDSFAPALWATTDGGTWSQQILRTSFNDGFTVFGGRMYVLSTAPDSRLDAPSFQLSMAGLDGGSERVVGLDIAPDFGIDTTRLNIFSRSLVGVGPRGAVLSTSHEGYIDFYGLMPAEYQRGNFWPEPSRDGLRIIDGSGQVESDECRGEFMDRMSAEIGELERQAAESEDWAGFEEALRNFEREADAECAAGGGVRIAETIPWADLGLEGLGERNDLQQLRTSSNLFIPDPEVAEPDLIDVSAALPEGTLLEGIRAGEAGFVAAAGGAGGDYKPAFSPDGREWIVGPSAPGYPLSSGFVGSTPTVLFGVDLDVRVMQLIDGGWQESSSDTDAVDSRPVAGGVGPLGVVVIYEVFSEGDFFEEGAIDGPGVPLGDFVPGIDGWSGQQGQPTHNFRVRFTGDGINWVPVLATKPRPCCAYPSAAVVTDDKIVITIGASNPRQESRVIVGELR
jgi:hypothetical protein